MYLTSPAVKVKSRVAVSIWLISPHDGGADQEPSILRMAPRITPQEKIKFKVWFPLNVSPLKPP